MSENITLTEIATKLKLTENGILNVFVLGSRLWGTHAPTSDWDLLIVHADMVGKTSGAYYLGRGGGAYRS